MMTTLEQQLREEICLVGKEMYQYKFVDGTAGNISARLDSNHILITPSGLSKGFMKPEQLIIIDMDGNRVDHIDETARLNPSTETPMHLEAYKRRSDVNGVVHAHPPYAVALTMAGINMQTYTIPEAIILLGAVPNAPYATPATPEDREVIEQLVVNHDAIMLSFHGSLTVGKDVWQAFMRLETLEHTAHLTYLVHQLGGGKSLPEQQIRKLLTLRQEFGLMHPDELSIMPN